MGWQSIKSAPRDGTRVMVKTAVGRKFLAFYDLGLVDDNENECGGWFEEKEGTAPSCWTDGICWASNGDGVPSDPPVEWTPYSF